MDDDDHTPFGISDCELPRYYDRRQSYEFEQRGEHFVNARMDYRCKREHLPLNIRYYPAYPAEIEPEPDDPGHHRMRVQQ